MQGVVVPASADWAIGDVTITFSLVMGGFAWGAVFGKYLDAWGARACCFIGERVAYCHRACMRFFTKRSLVQELVVLVPGTDWQR